MTASAERPLLFLDVDGPLLPFGPTYQPPYRPAPTASPDANPLLARLDPALGPRLAALPCTLVWATAWREEANERLGPLLGLPQLPVVEWSELAEQDALDQRAGLHWKTRTLLACAAGRPFAWVDDEMTDADRHWVTAHHPAPALLHRVDPGLGLTEPDFATLDAWLRDAVATDRAGTAASCASADSRAPR